MNRQKIKYLMCLIYNLIGILIVYNFVTGIIDYKTFGRFCLDMLPFLFYLALSFTFLVTNMDTDALKQWDGYTSVHEKRDDKIKQLTS